MIYIVVDVGCLECGNSSELVGVYPDHDAALAAAKAVGRTIDTTAAGYDAEADIWHGECVTVIFGADLAKAS